MNEQRRPNSDETAPRHNRDRDPGTLDPETAVEMWIDDKSVEWKPKTERDYRKNMRRWLRWCHDEGVEQVGELDGWDIRLFKRSRASDTNRDGEEIAPSTLRSSMMTLKQLVKWLVSVDAAPPRLHDQAGEAVPTVSGEDATDDTMLALDRARAAIRFYRDSLAHRATVNHAMLEVFLHVGCRVSGLRALDLGDYDPATRTLEFVNRPDTDTRLKNGQTSERMVYVSAEVAAVLDEFIARERWDKPDEYGRDPLFALSQGRPTTGTLASRTYLATQPCVYDACPHGEHPDECQYRKRDHATKCPSSRSPHPLRTTSITWHANRGVPMEKTSKRVDATLKTIKKYYDKPTREQELARREDDTADLDFADDLEEESDP